MAMDNLEFVGAIGLPVASASGVLVRMDDAAAITFYTFEDDGSTILTLTESSDSAGTGEQALAAITRIHKYPGIGGAYTLVTQAAASTYDLADDTVNDATAITIFAADMSDGFDYIEATVDGGTCLAPFPGLGAIVKELKSPEKITSCKTWNRKDCFVTSRL